MTTIAYKDGVIAYDSYSTQGSQIEDADFNKRINHKGISFFISGVFYQYQKLINAYCDESIEVDLKDACINLLICDKGKVFICGVENKKIWIEPVLKTQAIGSGESYALAAMDMGATAKEAVKIASNRDVYTGGRIRTFKVK